MSEAKELRKQLRRGNWTKAIEAANLLRSRSPGDEDAIRGKCYALIQLGKIDQALELAQKNPQLLSFELGYCRYRRGEHEQALSCGGHLEAQSLYRLGRFAEAVEAYTLLLDDPATTADAQTHAETLANLVACAVMARQPLDADVEPDQALMSASWELTYNYALTQEPARAATLLRLAEAFCKDAGDEEELPVVHAQLAYVTGDQDLYKSVLRQRRGDAVAAVAANNLVALRGLDSDLFDSFKKLRAAEANASPGPNSEALRFNKSLLLAYMRRADALEQELPAHSPEEQRVLRATLHFRAREFDEVLRLVGDSDPLVAAQTHLAMGDARAAADALASVEAVAGRPATVATLAALYSEAGDDDAALAVFAGASGSAATLEAAADFQLAHGRFEEAAASYERLVDGSAGPVDADARQRAMANLVIACSHFDRERAELYADRLPAVAADPVSGGGDIDVDALEGGAPAAAPSRRVAAAVPASAKPVAPERRRNRDKIMRRRARNRERYLAKLQEQGKFDPARPAKPDEDRWLPRYMRGRRGRRRAQRHNNSSQGVEISAKEAAKYDAAERAARRAAEDKPAAVVVSAGSGQRKAKKKKKGKKRR